MLSLFSCQQPEYKLPDAATKGINSFTAYFIGDSSDENVFSSEIDYENHVITVVFPYTYPSNTVYHLEESDLEKVKVVAGLDDNCYLEPAVLTMDLTKDNIVTLIDQRKERTEYIVRGEIRKSAECAVTSFRLVDQNLTGVVNESTKVISIGYDADPDPQLAEVELSFGASITGSVDPTKTACDYSKDVTFTVLAQDGKTTADYTVRVELPSTLDKGARPNSGKVLWNVKLKEEYGLTKPLMMTSMAVIKDYVVLNTRAEDLLVVDRKTGSKVGTIALPFKGNLTNFKITGDYSDNILITNLASDKIVVYRVKGINGTPTEYMSFTPDGSYGRGISITGSLDSDAIITMPKYQDSWSFLRWTVTNGVLNPTPENVAINCELNAGTWVYNCDITYTSATDTAADYFINSYAPLVSSDATVNRASIWMDGASGATRCHSAFKSSNWVRNAGDYVEFNKVGFYAANSVNSFPWGSDDKIFLYDLSGGNLDNLLWESEAGVYGSMATIVEANGNACSDVALRVSDDGYYMYLYFFFAGGRLVCVQFDCLDM